MARGLSVQLLGPFEVWVDDQVLPPAVWPSRKACQLLKILVTFRQRPVASDELIEWLWPDLALVSAHNSLWVAISRVRHLLEPALTERGASSYILTTPSGYRFQPGETCEIDIERFQQLTEVGQLHQQQRHWLAAIDAYRAAEALYRGDYLLEDPYEDWAIPARQRWREASLDLQEALATCLLAQGRCNEALGRARQVLDVDECRENAWRLAMEAHYRAGNPAQALSTFELCRVTLAEALGVDPQAETLALHCRILRHPIPIPQPAPAALPAPLLLRLPFVGRESVWTRLSEALERAMAGCGAVVLIAGESGIGKSRLLEELGGLAIARGARVLTGHCYELEQNTAYAPIVEALRTLLPAIAGSPQSYPPALLAALTTLLPDLRELWPDLPVLSPLSPNEERTRLLAALDQILRRCAQTGPLALLLDDLHWADPSTVQLLHYLGRQVNGHALLLVGAFRTTRVDPHHPLITLREQLARLHVLTEITLPAFGKADIALLLEILSGERGASDLVQQLYRETEGHPYFLSEVLRTLAQEGIVAADEQGRWRMGGGSWGDLKGARPLPSNIRSAVLGRLDRLPLDDRRLLDYATVIGTACSLPLLAQLLDQPESLVAERAERLSAKAFLQSRLRDGYVFSHELMRRAAYEALSEPRRRLLHRQVAETLQSLGAEPGSVATHFAASDRPWLALDYFLTAAEQATRVAAYEEAIACCQQAMAIADAHPTAHAPGFRTRLHIQQRTLWYYRGDLERCLEDDRAALAAARKERDLAGELQALWHLAHDETQTMAGGVTGLQAQAVALARTLGDPAAEARSLARLGSDTGFLAAPAERPAALATLDRAIGLARQVGDSRLLHYVLCESWGIGRLPEARTALEEALALVRSLNDPQEEVGTLAKLADLLSRQGDFPAATRYAREGLVLAEQVGNPTYEAWNRRSLGQALAAVGDVDQGLSHLIQAAETFSAHAWQAMLAGTLLRQGLVLHKEGEEECAILVLESVVALARQTCEVYEEAYALAALGEARLALGDADAGRQDLAAAGALLPRVGLPWHRGGTLLYLAAGRMLQRDGSALEAADEAIALAEAEDLRGVLAEALRIHERILGSK